MSKNSEGWIRHRGGKCPVEDGAKVDYRMRNNRKGCGERAELLDWGRDEECPASDIMDCRLHKPVEQVEACSKPELQINMQDGYGEIYNAQAIEHGPLQWRDRIAEIDATTQALTTERAELVQKLACEGFALIGRVVEPVEDMSDWRNWKVGDLVEYTGENDSTFYIAGVQYTVESIAHDFLYLDDESGGHHKWTHCKDFKWHSRPSA